jgi:hypothetical protein
LRNDKDFSPFFMALLWVNMHFGASFLVERAITGLILIIGYTFVWIYVVHYDTLTLLNTQTLTYIQSNPPPAPPSFSSQKKFSQSPVVEICI